jgi:CBS domain-containing protein
MVTSRKIDPIIRPCTEDLPLEPSVGIGEKITRAIEVMVSHNLTRIAVVRNQRAIGVIRLEDAFSEIGLQIPGRL